VVVLNNAAGGAVGRLVTGGPEQPRHRHGSVWFEEPRPRSNSATPLSRGGPWVVTEDLDWVDAVRESDRWPHRRGSAGSHPVVLSSADLLGMVSPGGTVVVYGRMADEPIPVHASALGDRGLTLRGATIGPFGSPPTLAGAACLRHPTPLA